MSEGKDPAPGRASLDDGVSARDMLESAPDALVVVDERGHIVQVNGLTEQLFGCSRAQLVGLPVEALVPARYRQAHLALRSGYQRDPRRRPMGAGPELYGLRRDGTEFPVEISLSPLRTARGTLVVAAVRDITARKEAEAERARLLRDRALFAETSRLARLDALTGLPNRTLLTDRLTAAVAAAGRHGHHLAVLFLVLDRFKQINDSLGHGTGDALLKAVAARLSESVRTIDTVSRQGGDEFVILLTEVHRKADVAAVAEKIMTAVAGPHAVGTQELRVTASIGVALYPDDGTDAETLIKHADVAMYDVKDHGRDGYRFFDRDMNARIVQRQALEARLRGALGRREFVLHYQPKVDLATGAMVGAEALVRWQQPDGRLMPPALFIPMAEDTGLIVPLGRWILREACRQARAWQQAGFAPLPVAVNISALEFRNKGFLQGVRSILDETGLEPKWLELELTESVLMESVDSSSSVLRELKAMGIGLAVDDFGTGYSSLSYLMEFPIDALKVDQSFVRDITSEKADSPIITAVISMGRSLQQRVIAEGIETETQLAFLQALRCCEGQGFHFSPPLAPQRFEALLEHA
jgi:diguanylate cyclase (GGDEF)-like protein/PAS domain S-box-containing protein